MKKRYEEPKSLAEVHPRTSGVLILVVMGALFYYFIFLRIANTEPGEYVRISNLLFGATFMFSLYGVVLLVLGRVGLQLMMGLSQPGMASKITVGVMVVLTFIAFQVFKSWLRDNGYIE